MTPYAEQYEKRIDPFGRPYYWATAYPLSAQKDARTDLSAIAQGAVALTPLDYDMTRNDVLAQMKQWELALPTAD